MKIAFSTLGCPDWSFDRILDEARRIGCQGIEIRGIEGKMRAEEIVQFFPENAAQTKKKLADHGLVITNFGSSCRFEDAANIPAAIEEGKAAIDVCQRMGIPAVRVFGNAIPEGADEVVITRQVTDNIGVLCDYAKDKGVEIWLETHGDFNTLERIAAVTNGVNRPNFGILWDIAHTDKVYGADFTQFYSPMKGHIRHLHIKDQVREDGKFVLVMSGEGEIPISGIVNRLSADGFNGFFSLEWEKKWHPELPEPEIAFPAYAELMQKIKCRG